MIAGELAVFGGVYLFMCLFVCLFVCEQYYNKTVTTNAMQFSEYIGNGNYVIKLWTKLGKRNITA